MPLNLGEVNLFSDIEIKEGDMFLYSSDFNGGLNKADIEIESLRRISECGGVAVILAHKGRYKKGDTPHLNEFAEYLSKRLKRYVHYYSYNNTRSAIIYSGSLGNGGIAIMGNTRMNEGEEENSSGLARQFADLALKNDKNAKLVIGGPGKAHRKNASNYAIQDFMPACAAPSLINEMTAIEPWAGKSGIYSVAVLGGVKGEKIKDGLVGFANSYHKIILGGIVLNSVFDAQGKNIGDSVIMDDGKKYTKYAEDVLRSENAKKLCIPEKVIIAKPAGKKEFADARQTHIDEGVPKGWMIVGSVLPDSALDALNNVEKKGGRLLVAGTPGIVGLDKATPVIVEYANSKNIKAVIVGGDTSSEIKSSAFSLTIGGAGLHYAAYGTTPVWEKLIENKRQFSAW